MEDWEWDWDRDWDSYNSSIRYRSGSDLYQGSQYGDYKATHRPWDEDNLRIGSKGRQLSRGSSASTFDEVESLCLSKSSSDSFNLYRRHGVGVAAGRGGKLLSRQSSTTSTSTSSGHPGEALDKRSQSTSTSGSVHEEGGMETLDPRQQFNLGDPAFLDRIFRRVLDWNNMYGAAGGDMHGKGGGIGTGGGRNFGVLPPSMQAASRATSGSPMMHGSPALGRRAKDMQAKKQMSPTSDITHVKRRRDLIIPDEDEEYPFAPNSLRRPGDLKGRSGGKDSSVGSTTSVSSSKQISSDSFSMMSSGSSMSQDLNWRDQLVHGWREMTGQRYNEQPSSYGMFTRQGSQTWRDHPHYHHQQQQHPPPSTFHPISGMMPPGFMPHPSTFSRGMSVESLGSMGIPSPPAETFRYGNPLQPFPPNQMQNQAEMMLMNLGFGSSDGFLPERFLRDWYNKVMRAQMQSQQQAAPAGAPLDAQDSLYGSASNLHNVDAVRGPQLPNRKPSFDDVGSASDLHHVVHHPSGRLMTSSAASHASSDSHDVAASNLPPVLDKDERIDRLKEYIEAYAQNMSTSSDSRTGRIRQFANARQKSLPLYLETLSEEDEGKARKAAFDPLDKESRLQAFLREDSFSTSGRSESHPSESSGPTSCEQSMCGSESDSMSGSDHQAYINYSRKHGVSGVSSVSTFGNPTPGVSHTLTLKVPGYSLAEPSENCVHSETGNDIVKGDGEGLVKPRTHHQPLVNDASFKEVFNESKDCDHHSAVEQHTTESSVSPTSHGTQHHHH
ncbi:uncharacterized protein LOC112561806 [Pomacea canaliculata]|uniref:uncharacterized protein LOC112561806 n=1 Tax=Pomacea canaliculata TaxID=400727 RepID=UPI000D73E9D1|nr:uncharacterized protein LOC112561806 [Pomacea canaliculata]